MSTLENRRILLIDDQRSIHEDFRKALSPSASFTDLEADEALLFDSPKSAAPLVRFEMDSAFQGAEGLEKVRAAHVAGLPYAMAFIDLRMPPGWDGVETAERLWLEEPRLQIVFCTAYPDTSWTEVSTRCTRSPAHL
jgi:CheY-like chemotaxis protein